MMRRKAKFFDGFFMKGRRVARICLPTIFRKLKSQFIHQLISISFGKNRCCGNRQILSVAFYNTCMRNHGIRRKPIAINKYSGKTASFSTARCIAKKLAFKILILSISWLVASATAQYKVSCYLLTTSSILFAMISVI